MKKLEGMIPIAAGTFTDQGKLDEDSFQQMVRHLLKTGVQGIALFGVATEFYKLTDRERERMTEILLKETRSSDTVLGMISITDHSHEIAVERARKAEEMGADSLMLLPPFFLHPSEQAIKEHIEKVASAVSIPIVVQYAPLQTGIPINPETFIEISERHPNVQFIKVETQPPGRYVSSLLSGSNERLGALVGYAGVQMPDVLRRGAKGILPGCSFSEIYVQLYRYYQQGELDAFEALFHRLLPYLAYWMQGVELIIKVEKVILKRRGIIASDYCRSPYYPLDDREYKMIDLFLDQFTSFLLPTEK